ncbi:hypothetical protein K7X08_013474 [Anisodus acutangulus]|uniref:Uncharacterized protein n=1 Tax=Anisodus acutangulus TaxID=402998 RepID=A0A9Q1LKD6_9SOLA|nr:hypothetical protein K7X08_013474 [Anisodus acutangulus]
MLDSSYEKSTCHLRAIRLFPVNILINSYIFLEWNLSTIWLDYQIRDGKSCKFNNGGSINNRLARSIANADYEKDEADFMNLLRIMESSPGLYYSYETGITLNLHRRYNLAKRWMSKPVWKQDVTEYQRMLSPEAGSRLDAKCDKLADAVAIDDIVGDSSNGGLVHEMVHIANGRDPRSS